MITVDLWAKSFGADQVLGQISLQLDAGEVAAIVGPSGVGKSTLLRIIAGLDTGFDGHVSRSGRLGMVFQEPTLLPWRTARENLSVFHPGLPAAELDDMMRRVGLGAHAAKFPKQLSLGQQRRLSLARAFLGRPEVLAMDEPFASLDPELRDDMVTLTETLLAEVRPATLLVTHDLAEAKRLASQIWTLDGQPARLSATP